MLAVLFKFATPGSRHVFNGPATRQSLRPGLAPVEEVCQHATWERSVEILSKERAMRHGLQRGGGLDAGVDAFHLVILTCDAFVGSERYAASSRIAFTS